MCDTEQLRFLKPSVWCPLFGFLGCESSLIDLQECSFEWGKLAFDVCGKYFFQFNFIFLYIIFAFCAIIFASTSY